MQTRLTRFETGSMILDRFRGNDRFFYAFPGLPPTANRIWRVDGKTHRSTEYVRWTELRRLDFFFFRPPACPEGGFAVDLLLWPPNRRRFDVDNRIKPTMDMLTHAKVWPDDSLVTAIHAYKRPEIVPGGWTLIHVRPSDGETEPLSETMWRGSEILKPLIPKEASRSNDRGPGDSSQT